MQLSQSITSDHDPVEYSLWRSGEVYHAWEAVRLFESALRFQQDDTSLFWRVGRAALVAGSATKAASALAVDMAVAEPTNRIRLLNTLEAQSRANNHENVLTLYGQSEGHAWPLDQGFVDNAVAFAYLSQAQAELSAMEVNDARQLLHKAIDYRPFDMYASYWLWKTAQTSDEAEEAYERLYYFSPEAVKPEPDERFLRLFLTIFPDLAYEEGWGSARNINLARYWVWQYPEWSDLGDMLEKLNTTSSNQVVWEEIQQEWHSQFERTSLAESARSEIGSKWQSRSAVETSTLFSHSSTAYSSSLSRLDIASQMLELPIEAIDIGPNLLGTTASPILRFNVDGGARKWPFVEGFDVARQSLPMRIFNLWWPAEDTASGFTPYAEYHGKPFELDSEWVMVSFLYRVDGNTDDMGLLGIGNALSTDWMPLLAHVVLPETSGQWVQAVVVSKVLQPDTEWFLLLRNWGAASVWFDYLEVFPVDLATAPMQCLQDACVYFRSLGQP